MPAQKRRTRTREAQRVFAAVVLAVSLVGCSSADDAAAEDLIGTWVVPNGPTWEIADGSIDVLQGVASGLTYTGTSTTIEIVEQPGPSACPPDQPGTYEWEIEDDVLSLTAVNDECSGRREFLDGISFERDE